MSRSAHNIINTWSKLTRYQHHYRFLTRCKQLNSIPRGLKLNFNLALGSKDQALKQRCEQHLFTASLNILKDLVNFANTTTHKLQRQLEEERKNLFHEHDQITASNSWNQAKKSIATFNRSLNLKYRNKIKKILKITPTNQDNAEHLNEGYTPTHRNRRFSKKVRLARKQKITRTVTTRVNKEKFFPINLSSRELDQDEKSLLSKGPSFCPVPRDVNRVKLQEDWEKFEHRVRLPHSFTIKITILILVWLRKNPYFPQSRKFHHGKPRFPNFRKSNYFLNRSKMIYLILPILPPFTTILQ